MSTRLDDEMALRSVIDDLANQLCLAVDGKFDLTVSARASDETVEKLAMLVNFVLDNARRALSELERRNESLAELDRLKSDLVANVSHELRTPLALIVGPAEMLADAQNLTELQRRDLDVIRRNATTLLKHVNDLLDVSKLESGKMELRYAELDLASLLRTVAGCFEALAPQREISCFVDAPAQLIGQVDAEKLERVLLNLLSNAFKFVPQGGSVRASMEIVEPDTVRIVVDDTGPGVRPALRERIFERFRQGDEGATRQFGGTGLGLPIAKDFVELHGGRITVHDAPGGGARFSVELPLRAPPGVPVAQRRQREMPPALGPNLKGAIEELKPLVLERSPQDSGRGDASRPCVLVVEDNPEMNRFVAESLACSFNVITASNGREGLALVLAHKLDLVITDIMMPSMSGDQLASEIRQRRELDSLPILVLSAKAEHALRVQLLREGVQDYILKPFSADELRARASNWTTVKRARDLLQSELNSQQHSLEELAREVTRKKREIEAALYQVNQAREEAERASEVKSSFLSMASHEFRTPLTTLRLQLDRLDRDKERVLADKQKAMVRKAFNSLRRLDELVESLLEYTRLEGGRLRLRPELFEPAVLCAEVLDDLRPRAEAKSLALRLAVPSDCRSWCDPRLLRLIVANLVDNAIKFTDAGSVSVRVAVDEGGHLQLSVEDTGPGIPADSQLRVFEPFEQLERINQKHKPGVGLGLAIVNRITEALGGRIELKSELGKGTLFKVSIPGVEKPGTVTLNRARGSGWVRS